MTDATEFDIGSQVACTDGPCGRLVRVVVDPVARAITYLVVEQRHHHGRLVPINQVASGGHEIRLRCTIAQFEVFERAEEEQLLSVSGEDFGYGGNEVMALPYFALTAGEVSPGARPLMSSELHPTVVTEERVPVGEVEIRRGEHVHATDGSIGHVEGLIVDPADHHVTHVLLQEGHLWGHKTVAIPISSVERVDDGVRLKLSKDQVRDLPSVDVDTPA